MRLPVLLLAAAAASGLLAGCGPPPELTESPPPPRSPGPTALASPTPAGLAPVLPDVVPTPGTRFPDDRAVRCDGNPDADTMLGVLHAEELLPEDLDAEVADGPMCAGTWQYAVVSVPERDPLQMVTRGDPDTLELVTAGTDVCTVDVRILAPPGIRDAADCVG